MNNAWTAHFVQFLGAMDADPQQSLPPAALPARRPANFPFHRI
jgi:hypothetical protein